jgi:hypothetical protein
MEDHPVALGFINNIIKSCLRKSSLKQIGRSPLFFMPEQAKVIADAVETWPGFFTSSWIYQRGLYLIIDNVSKFMSIESCLAMMDERFNRGFKEPAIDKEFEGAVVMTKYGSRRTYKVSSIKWKMNPHTYTFQQEDKKATMADYFKRVYKIGKLLDQPLFEIQQKRGTIYLPPELC